MKQFVKNQTVTYNLMSFTGFKALLIFSMLIDGPKSYEEISHCIENNPYMRERISIDTMRVYINSLKRIGCEIKRVKGEDKISRYVITSHPFELNLPQEQIQSAIKVYKSLVKNMDIKDIIYMDKFFEKIGKYIKNDELIFAAKKVSLLKGIDITLLEELLECCEKKLQIIISYNSPQSGIKDVEILTDKVDIQDDKIYLYGFGFEYKQVTSFLVNRIQKIKEIKDSKTINVNIKTSKIIYELHINQALFDKKDYEKIITKEADKLLIEANITNKFLLKQRLLQFGPACKILEPAEFRDEFIQFLKDMKAGYYCG